MVQFPGVMKVRAPAPVIVHTPGVEEVNDTFNDEVEVAVRVGVLPKFCDPGLAKVIVCGAAGVTVFDAADATPVPILLVAVTVKLYAVPFVRPVTVMGLLGPEAVNPPGLDVTVYPVIDAPPLDAGAVKVAVA